MFDDKYLQDTLDTAFSSPTDYFVPMGITRYDYAKMHGWWVRLHRDEAQFQELFFDSKYSTIEEGLRAAILYRHEILNSFPLEKKIKVAAHKRISEDPEQRIHRRVEKGKNQPYVCWLATWYDNDYKVKTKRFSVRKFGEDEARSLALQHTIEHHNLTPKPLTEMANIDPYLKPKYKKLSHEDVEVLASVDGGPYKARMKEVEASYPFAFEGSRNLEIHVSIERDRKLRNAKVNDFLEKNGAIYCELCSTRFTDFYPFLEKDIIEVHHIVPLSMLSNETKTTFSDLMLLCSNCHLAIHQGDAEINLASAIDHFKK